MDLFNLFKYIDTRIQKSREGQKQNRRERLEKIFFPIYQDALEIHDYYLELFKGIRDQLPTIVDKEHHLASVIENPGEKFKVRGQRYTEILDSLKTKLRHEERDSNDRFRDQVKARVFSWLVQAQGMEEKKFVLSLVLYFLEHNGPYMDSEPSVIRKATELEHFFRFQNMNNFDERQINHFLNEHFDTPKSMIYARLAQMDDAEEIRQVLIEKENELGWYMKLVSVSYVRLQASAYQNG